VGIESTVLDLTVSPPQILRPGMIHEESLAAVVGEVRSKKVEVQAVGPLRSPGWLKTHYAPKAKLLVLNWRNGADLKSQLATRRLLRVTCHVIAHTHIPSAEHFTGVSLIPHDAAAFARALYAELHRCDEAGAELIVVEAPPALPEWSGIADRLKRAAA
jgi:L-threonylcarbamoyladenylate synthase